MSGRSTKILLVEFAAVDRFHRGVLFPYFYGYAKSEGAPALWLRFGVRAATRFIRGEQGIGLDEDDLSRLLEEAAAFCPTRIILSARPSSSLREALQEAAPLATLHLLGETYAGDDGDPKDIDVVGGQLSAWADLVGAHPPTRSQRPFWAAVTPDFGYRPANPEASTMQPLPFILLGEECSYNRPLSRNALFDGVDLSGCVRRGGCSFCARPPSQRVGGGDLRRSLRRQLESLVRTLPDHPGRLAVRLMGEPALKRVELLARACLECSLPPSDLLLDCRASSLLRRQASLARAAASLEGTGHKLHMALIGIESFSRRELERMNKGVSPLENLDAALALFRLEEQYPDSFGFREHGGLSLIVFTPWTTLEELAATLCLVRDTGLAPICGKLFTSRLRLEPSLPITALAQRDGLLVDLYDDPALDTAARNLYGPELPWRFQDERVEPVCRVLIRLSRDRGFEDDPLTGRVRQVSDLALQEGWDDADLAVGLVEQALASHSKATPSELLDGVVSIFEHSPAQVLRAREAWEGGEASGDEEFLGQDLLVALSNEGIKPVSKIEPVSPERVELVSSSLAVPVVRVRRRLGNAEVCEVFFGQSEVEVERALELTRGVEAARSPAEEERLLLELGPLLGYPLCCVEAFAKRESRVERESYAWLHLARRMSVGGAVPVTMNPWAGVLVDHYVPCSLLCERSHDLTRRALDVVVKLEGRAFIESLLNQMSHPWLVLLGTQGAALELINETRPTVDGEIWKTTFRPGVVTTRDWELARACQADAVWLDRERLVLLRRGEEILDLSSRAFIWWHERPLQAELWTRVLALRSSGRAGSQYGERSTPIRLRPNMEVLRRGLEEALRSFDEARGRFGGLEGWQLRPDTEDRLVLILGKGADATTLYVTDAREAERFFFRLGPLAFSVPSDHKLETSTQRVAVRDLARHLKGWLSRSGGPVKER